VSATPPPLIGPADHPRASGLIRRAKAWGGLAGFGITLLGTTGAGVPFQSACARSLLGGIACYLIAWMIAVTVSRALLKAHGQAAVERVLEQRRRQAAAQSAAAVAVLEAASE
jgi:hypothetical protein